MYWELVRAVHADKGVLLFTSIGITRELGKNIFCIDYPFSFFLGDYGLNDLAQLRFSPNSKISDQFYVRNDGTRSYFFTISEISQLAKSADLEVLNIEEYRKEIENKKQKKIMKRIWIQATFRKPN